MLSAPVGGAVLLRVTPRAQEEICGPYQRRPQVVCSLAVITLTLSRLTVKESGRLSEESSGRRPVDPRSLGDHSPSGSLSRLSDHRLGVDTVSRSEFHEITIAASEVAGPTGRVDVGANVSGAILMRDNLISLNVVRRPDTTRESLGGVILQGQPAEHTLAGLTVAPVSDQEPATCSAILAVPTTLATGAVLRLAGRGGGGAAVHGYIMPNPAERVKESEELFSFCFT